MEGKNMTTTNTVAEIRAELDAKGISYKKKATKNELLSLLGNNEQQKGLAFTPPKNPLVRRIEKFRRLAHKLHNPNRFQGKIRRMEARLA
jgi:hypothetical protein